MAQTRPGNRAAANFTSALQVSIWDCAGRGDFADVRSEFHREVQCVCLVADSSERRPARNLEKWYAEAVNTGGEAMAGRMVLVGIFLLRDFLDRGRESPRVRRPETLLSTSNFLRGYAHRGRRARNPALL